MAGEKDWDMLKRPRLPTRLEPRQPRSRATREHILEAASRCLRTEGAQVTMTRIAEVAGYSIGTVYQYFPDRQSLLCELMHGVCEAEFETVLSALPGLMKEPIANVVSAVLELLVRSAAEHRVLTKLLVVEVMPRLGEGAVEDLLPMVSQLLAQQLADRSTETTTTNYAMAAHLILTGVEGVVHATAVERPEVFDDPMFVVELQAFVAGYLQAARPPSPRPQGGDPGSRDHDADASLASVLNRVATRP